MMRESEIANYLLEQVSRVDVYKDRLAIRVEAQGDRGSIQLGGKGHSLSIPWQKPPSRKSRQILIPHGVTPRTKFDRRRIERRARVVSAIARGRRWLDEIVSGSVTDVQQIAARQKCSVRQVKHDHLASFPRTRASSERRLKVVCHAASGSSGFVMPPAEWSRQFEVARTKSGIAQRQPRIVNPGTAEIGISHTAGWPLAAPNSAAGNGIFGSRDRRLEIGAGRPPTCH